MDLNVVNVTGQVTSKSFKDMSWGKALSLRVGINPTEFLLDGSPQVVTGQELWMDVTVPKDHSKVTSMLDKIDRGCIHVAVVDATFSSYVQKSSGQTKYKVKASFGRVWLSTEPYKTFNHCLFTGDVEKQQPYFMELKVTYTNPKGKTSAERWPSRIVPVTIPYRVPSFGKRRKVLVTGQLATKDGQGRDFLNVVATEIL